MTQHDQHPGSTFLHQHNTQFHSSPDVELTVDYLRKGGERIPNSPPEKIAAYLGFLANPETANDGILTGDSESMERQIESRVIKAEKVPEGYFELQRRIAREQGHGDIQITPEMRAQWIAIAQADQRASLKNWANYLSGDDAGYPDWFKHYAWNAVAKLGAYDKDKKIFQKRSNGTTTPFAELNREALAYVYDSLHRSKILHEHGEGADDEKLQKLLKGADFGKLYSFAFNEVTPDTAELRQETRGEWVTYKKSSNKKKSQKLSSSLQGHGTGWCTAGEEMAHAHLKGGDFHVYYSRDEEGKNTIPRIAVRMEGNEVVEVRGVEKGQELEPSMADIVSERLDKLPGTEEYKIKAENMKLMTKLDKKLKENPNAELTHDEVRFIYEVETKARGFGYGSDPRARELRELRGDRDLAELALLARENVHNQLRSSMFAYKDFAAALKKVGWRDAVRAMIGGKVDAGVPGEIIEQQLQQKDRVWLESGVYDYLATYLKDGIHHSLVVTPNETASVEKADNYINTFSAYAYGETAKLSAHYTDEEFSGSTGDSPVRISLISYARDEALWGAKSAKDLQQALAERQEQHPDWQLHAPSPLEAVSFWFALRRSGGLQEVFDSSIIHFDQRTKNGKVLISSIDRHGKVSLSSQDPDDITIPSTRFAIG